MIPNSKETYMSPVMYHRPNGEDIILFGSGGETVPGLVIAKTIHAICILSCKNEKKKIHVFGNFLFLL